MNTYLIDVASDGRMDVLRNRKAFAYDLEDFDEAFYRIKRDRKYQKGDRVEIVDAEGYRRRVTSL